ncbi:MICOS complex subunit MIC10-like [Lycorma delicatula]|uniref:MICOS complex subunit MIC10-like n=1 Tax=Lycorma delicatula TaxID=130591 RepID=UPI003F513DF4
MHPEQEFETQLSNCVTDAIFKSGTGFLIGSLASLFFFKRRMLPAWAGMAFGLGISCIACEDSLNRIIIVKEEEESDTAPPEQASFKKIINK